MSTKEDGGHDGEREDHRPAKGRRSYGDAFKARVSAKREAPGASVAKVVMSPRVNGNFVHRWRQRARERRAEAAPVPRSEFVPVTLTATSACPTGHDIRVAIRRGATAMTISWPSAVAECVTLLSEWLK